MSEEAPDVDSSSDKHECSVCGRLFETPKGLAIHQSLTHDNDDKPWQDVERLRELKEKGLTPDEIGNKLGCDRQTALKALREHFSLEGCPIDSCSYECVTRQGLGSHMANKHETTLLEYEQPKGDHNCPFDGCNYTSVTEMGVKVHYGLSHPGSIAGVLIECQRCGKEVRKTIQGNGRTPMFCGDECHYAWRSETFTGENHPLWLGDNVAKTCEYCNEEFAVRPYDTDSRFCGIRCQRQWLSERDISEENNPLWIGREEIDCMNCGDLFEVRTGNPENRQYCCVDCADNDPAIGSDHPLWGGRVSIECEICGTEISVLPSKAESRRCCSKECLGEWRSRNFNGEDHPNWRGGKSIYDAVKRLLGNRSFESAAEDTRENANRVCEACDKTREQNGRRLDAHHLVPVLAGGTNGNYNLMALCRVCHRKAELFTRRRIDPILTDWTEEDAPREPTPADNTNPYPSLSEVQSTLIEFGN